MPDRGKTKEKFPVNLSGRIEVTDPSGWQKDYVLDRAIIHIGSHPRNEIVLDAGRGRGVAPRHAQLIPSPAAQGYVLVNLGDSDIVLSSLGNRPLPPRESAPVGDGEIMILGEFRLRLMAGESASNALGLDVVLPQTQVSPDYPLDGVVMVRNLGTVPKVQIRLTLSGLDGDLYQLAPGPVLFPGAEKEVPLRLLHPRRALPGAGEYRFTVRATAPDAYPGEQVSVTRTIQLLPYFRHSARLIEG